MNGYELDQKNIELRRGKAKKGDVEVFQCERNRARAHFNWDRRRLSQIKVLRAALEGFVNLSVGETDMIGKS